MSKSDFFVVFTIALAITALFSEKNRKFRLMKFSLLNWAESLIVFMIMHFFVWSEEWTCWRKTMFDINWCPLPSTYAYILFIFLLIWFIWKIGFAEFPKSNHPKLIKEYMHLLGVKDIDTLKNLFEKYHLKNMVQFYEKYEMLKREREKKMEEETKKDIAQCKKELEECKTKISQNDEELISKKRKLEIELAALTMEDRWDSEIQNEFIQELEKFRNSDPSFALSNELNEKIIRNKDFISGVVDIDPFFFCPFIKYYNEKNDEFVNSILSALIKKKEHHFFKEINQGSKMVFLTGYPLNSENFPILNSLFENANIAVANSVWFPMGEEAMLELKDELQKEMSFLRYEKPDNDYSEDAMFSNTTIYVAINFFKIMESCCLLQGIEDDDWILYYMFFTDLLLKNMRIENLKNNDKVQAYFLIKKMVINLGGLNGLALIKDNETHKKLLNHCATQMIRKIEQTDRLESIVKNELIEGLKLN